MKPAVLLSATLAFGLTARADFSYMTTAKSSGGLMPGAGEGRVTKHYLKGQRLKLDRGDTATILDLEAQTITSLNHTRKTYTLKKFTDLAEWREEVNKAGVEINIDVKDTGQRRNINGFNAHEVIMSMEFDSPQARQAGAKSAMETSMWVSRDVPGSQEVLAFYKRNAGRFPWSELAGGGAAGNPRMQKAMSGLYRKMAAIDGVPVLQVTRMKAILPEAQMAQAQQAMAQARAKLEEAKRKGGQQAAMAEQALAMMGRQAEGSLFEYTLESSNFSTNSIPEAVFAVPPGYQLSAQK